MEVRIGNVSNVSEFAIPTVWSHAKKLLLHVDHLSGKESNAYPE
jgi:hypothetical protein